MINYRKVNKFWQNEAKKAEFSSGEEYQSGMLIKNSFVAKYRKIEEEINFESIINIDKNDQVLEMGCGSGRWTFFLASKCKLVTAIDFSDEMIKLAKSIQRKKNIKNIKFICKKAENYCDYKKYNIIYLSGFLQYLNDVDIMKLINNLTKMSDKKTLIISRDTISLTNKRITETGDYQVIYRTVNEYKNIFSNFSFKLIKTKESYIAPWLSCKLGLDRAIPFKVLHFFESKIFKGLSCFKMSLDKIFHRKKVEHCFFVYEKND